MSTTFNLGFSLHSDGAGHSCLTLGYNGEERAIGEKFAVTTGRYGTVGMNGREVYKFATREASLRVSLCLCLQVALLHFVQDFDVHLHSQVTCNPRFRVALLVRLRRTFESTVLPAEWIRPVVVVDSVALCRLRQMDSNA